MQHALITNDFPPKVGGIQSYLYELWRRLPSDSFGVLTSKSHPDIEKFDADQNFLIERGPKWLIPTLRMRRHVEAFISKTNAKFVVLDPGVPLGMIGPKLSVPYVVVLHGSEVTVPARLPLLRGRLAKVLRNAKHIISAGEYAADEARRLVKNGLPPITIIPPGVDIERFHPIDQSQRGEVRAKWNITDDDFVVIGHSRLVPRKGFDSLILSTVLADNKRIVTLIVGGGRDRKRLENLKNDLYANVRFLGRVSDEDLPQLLAASDVEAMLCRTRWKGLEQEGFGIVFLEAAASGIPQIAGRSGGAAEAVVDGQTGIVVDNPNDADSVATAISQLVNDRALRDRYAQESRARAESMFSYDLLSQKLAETLEQIAQDV